MRAYRLDRIRGRLVAKNGVHLLDGDTVTVDGVSFGGVGEIIGDPKKPGRRSEGDFLAALDLVVEQSPEVIVLHMGPNAEDGQRGSREVRTSLARAQGLVVCGHTHWKSPLAALTPALQVLNVDARAVVLRAK
ncbi:MAG: hypothetical protein AAGF12_01170 [Myxococcota bacterium]